MMPEVDEYRCSIEKRLNEIVAVVERMDAARLNWRPPVEGGNSAWVLATHTLGNARAWVLGIACGQAMRRDRPAEFASSGADAGALRAKTAQLIDEMEAALASLGPTDLERRLVPPQELWGEGNPREITVREAFLHVIEHASMHLGHVQMTSDLAAADSGR